jgi:inhibitor of cysteine peptidase
MNYKSIAISVMATIVLIVAVHMAGCAATPDVEVKSFNATDNNSTVDIKKGDTFKVVLDENPSTGYSWNASVTSGLSIVNDTYLPPNTDLLGASGTHVWEIKATGAGEQAFSGVYKRPWEPAMGNETMYMLTVKII